MDVNHIFNIISICFGVIGLIIAIGVVIYNWHDEDFESHQIVMYIIGIPLVFGVLWILLLIILLSFSAVLIPAYIINQIRKTTN